jgi:hypothetical protein
LSKLKQLYTSIEPVEEQSENGEENDKVPHQRSERPKSSSQAFHKKSKSYIIKNSAMNKNFYKSRQTSNPILDTVNDGFSRTHGDNEDTVNIGVADYKLKTS